MYLTAAQPKCVSILTHGVTFAWVWRCTPFEKKQDQTSAGYDGKRSMKCRLMMCADLSSSFFVGDAAGREGADGREDDFADSDKCGLNPVTYPVTYTVTLRVTCLVPCSEPYVNDPLQPITVPSSAEDCIDLSTGSGMHESSYARVRVRDQGITSLWMTYTGASRRTWGSSSKHRRRFLGSRGGAPRVVLPDLTLRWPPCFCSSLTNTKAPSFCFSTYSAVPDCQTCISGSCVLSKQYDLSSGVRGLS